jgi:hypothetical protein
MLLTKCIIMENSENKNSHSDAPSPGKKKLLEGEKEFIEDLPENLGLDADRSSDNDSLERKYNMDNEITAEKSNNNSNNLDKPFDSSPIMNK